MKNRYIDLIEQNFDFPTEQFDLLQNNLTFKGLDLMELVKEYGSPLRFSYLPAIQDKIAFARNLFNSTIKKHRLIGKYHYAYCTKSSHFSFVLNEVLKAKAHIETSSTFDLNIIQNLSEKSKIDLQTVVICNGFKTDAYLKEIKQTTQIGFKNLIAVVDHLDEIEAYQQWKEPLQLGIRIAAEEEPKFEFYTSRLGIRYNDVVDLYKQKIEPCGHLQLKMLHFFINTGISDTAYYWNELKKCLQVYCQLKRECPSLKYMNIGGGLPVPSSLKSDIDYEYIINEIIAQIKTHCDDHGVEHPDIFTEFGNFTVSESGGIIYQILAQKKQNDREKWNMINSSFMTTIPDAWALSKRFIMLPINRWNKEYERVFLGGLSCDQDDYYNSEQHLNAIFLPEFNDKQPQFIGFFNMGAYQESLSGFGGIKHCLIPSPKHVLIGKKDGNFQVELFSEEQKSEDALKILGY